MISSSSESSIEPACRTTDSNNMLRWWRRHATWRAGAGQANFSGHDTVCARRSSRRLLCGSACGLMRTLSLQRAAPRCHLCTERISAKANEAGAASSERVGETRRAAPPSPATTRRAAPLQQPAIERPRGNATATCELGCGFASQDTASCALRGCSGTWLSWAFCCLPQHACPEAPQLRSIHMRQHARSMRQDARIPSQR